ncbi:MAG: hypothetical protein LBM92_08510, partial [Opitutaceae bacterium]|nr:hypothetical protein [Opitutaceae bacterium]
HSRLKTEFLEPPGGCSASRGFQPEDASLVFYPVARRRFNAVRKEPSLRDGGFAFFVTVG